MRELRDQRYTQRGGLVKRVKIWGMKVPGSFWIGAVCATYLFTSCCAPAQAVPANSREVRLHSYLEQAAQAMHRGDLASAAENFRRALVVDPHSLAALNNLGIVLSRQGKPAEAIPLYQEALKFRPGSNTIRLMLYSTCTIMVKKKMQNDSEKILPEHPFRSRSISPPKAS